MHNKAETVNGISWILSDRRLILCLPKIELFWEVPDGFEMPSRSTLSLAEMLLLTPMGEKASVEPFKGVRGDRVAVAFSGGVDSAAALELLPNPIPVYAQVSAPTGRHVLDNALLAVQEVGLPPEKWSSLK